jgi:hypothetical protein
VVAGVAAICMAVFKKEMSGERGAHSKTRRPAMQSARVLVRASERPEQAPRLPCIVSPYARTVFDNAPCPGDFLGTLNRLIVEGNLLD